MFAHSIGAERIPKDKHCLPSKACYIQVISCYPKTSVLCTLYLTYVVTAHLRQSLYLTVTLSLLMCVK